MERIFILALCSVSRKKLESRGAPSEEKRMRKVADGDFVKVHYTGKFRDGEVFDSSIGCQPIEVQIGAHQVIAGFEDALMV